VKICKPPIAPVLAEHARVVFFAGTIDMGASIDWQADLARELADVEERAGIELAVLNPRRDAWDASWEQRIGNPMFREQVEWELDGLDRADVIAMWFAPDSKAPITLLELGLTARTGKLVVGCPDGFWRKGNIEVVAARHGIELAHDWTSFVALVRGRLTTASRR